MDIGGQCIRFGKYLHLRNSVPTQWLDSRRLFLVGSALYTRVRNIRRPAAKHSWEAIEKAIAVNSQPHGVSASEAMAAIDWKGRLYSGTEWGGG